MHVRSSNWDISYSLLSSQPDRQSVEREDATGGTHVSSLRGFVSSSLYCSVSLLVPYHEKRKGF